MSGRHLTPPVVFTGGVALVPGVRSALQTALNTSLTICPNPQTSAALGAALRAARKYAP